MNGSGKNGRKLEDLSNPGAYLRNALRENQFMLYGQRLLPLEKPAGRALVEVLVRMREEEKALLPPGEFLPVFQRLGMMPELDRWVLRETVTHFLRGAQAERFAVNISLQTLDAGDFPAFFAREVTFAGVSPKSILLEITESDARSAGGQGFASAIRDAGAGLVIEDFLCNESSIELMKLLGPEFVKVDGSIVRKLRSQDAARSLLSAAVKAALAGKTKLIAGGVEDSETLSVVTQLGAHHAQGFGIHTPQPIE